MADNRIELVAQLNTVESEKVIQGQLDAMKNLSVKVKCDIDMSSIKTLQSQLSNINTKVGNAGGGIQIVDKGALKSDVDAIIEYFDLTASKLQMKKNDLRNMLSEPVADFKKAFAANDIVGLEQAWYRLGDVIQKTSREIYVADEATIQAQNELKESLRSLGKVSIDTKAYDDLKYIAGSAQSAAQMMNTVFGVGNWTKGVAGSKNLGLDSLASELPQLGIEYNNVADAIQRCYNILTNSPPKMGVFDSIIAQSGKVGEAFDSVLSALKLPLGEYEIDEVSRKIQAILLTGDESLDMSGWQEATRQVNEYDAAVNKASEDSRKIPPPVGVATTTKETLENAKASINEFYKTQEIGGTADRVKRAIEDTSGSLQRFYVQVERGDKSVETLTYALNEQGTAYEYLGKVVREADNSTDFRSKDISTQWDIQTEKVRGFAAQLQNAGLTSEVFKKDLENLQAKLAARGDNNAMHSFLDDFDLLKAKAAAAAKEMQATNKAMREADAVATLGNRIKSTASALEAWGNANRKAVTSTKQMSGETTTYAEKFAELTRRINEYKSKLQSGTLTPTDISSFKHLTEEVNAYKKSADAAGLTTSRFFTNMNSQLRMVLQRWISLYAVIGYIRKMVEEVKSLDTAMINLKRVTDETDESYQQFLKNANSNAESLKTTTSSIVEQSYQWAKLGYSMDEALELANASTIYQRVGDVDQEQALSNLVTALKAYRLEASDTMGIVDKLDKLNNKFAVSASGLGQGLERSASAMAMTGNSLDQTLALLTGAGEITQNLENTGRESCP